MKTIIPTLILLLFSTGPAYAQTAVQTELATLKSNTFVEEITIKRDAMLWVKPGAMRNVQLPKGTKVKIKSFRGTLIFFIYNPKGVLVDIVMGHHVDQIDYVKRPGGQ